MGDDQTPSDVVAVDARGQLEQIRALHDMALGSVPFVVDSAGGVKGDDLVFGMEGEDGQLIAYLYASAQPPQRVHVWEVAVDPTVQRRGLGRALLRRLAKVCHPGGFELITVTPFAAPAEAATAFFSACGFHETDPEQAVQATPGEVLSATRATNRPTQPSV